MLSRINFDFETDSELKDTIEGHTDHFAREGLRVLIVGGKKISSSDYAHYKSELDRALGQKAEEREYALARLYGQLECDLKFIGSTAIEDKL